MEFTPRNKSLIQSLSIDRRWDSIITRWEYSFSTWIRIKPDTCNSTSVANARASCHILNVENHFMIFMPTKQTIALNIDAEREFLEYTSY